MVTFPSVVCVYVRVHRGGEEGAPDGDLALVDAGRRLVQARHRCEIS